MVLYACPIIVGVNFESSFSNQSAHQSQSIVWYEWVSKCSVTIVAVIMAWSEPVYVLCGG